MDEATAKQVAELREKAVAVVETMSKDDYYEEDLERLQSDDKWLLRFLQHRDFKMSDAMDMLIGTLKWRKSFGVHIAVREESFPKELFKIGAVYAATQDKQGHQILMFHIAKHQKDPDLQPIAQRFIVYWVEKLEKAKDGEKITVIFDMKNAGIGQLDFEMVKFFIAIFKNYYPNLLAHLLVYELPWMMSTAWNIVKNWLSTRAVKKIKFISKSNVNDYIADEELPSAMGGSSSFTYTYVSNGDSDSDSEPVTTVEAFKKKVRFAEGDREKFRLALVSGNYRKMIKNHKKEESDTYFNGKFLKISPPEELIFINDAQGDKSGMLYLMNNTEQCVAFKVKTTTPEKFRVRPSSGIVKPKCQSIVTVHLQFAYQNSSLLRDKFLIMAMEMETDDIANEQLYELWKKCPRDNIMEHKLKCSLSLPKNEEKDLNDNQKSFNNVSSDASVDQELSYMRKKLRNLHWEMRLFMVLTIALLLVMFFVLMKTLRKSSEPCTFDEDICHNVCLSNQHSSYKS